MTDSASPAPGSDPDEPTLADETRKLVAIVQDWTRRTFPAPPSGHGGPECQWCPLCQLASAMRGEVPELTERLAEAGAALVTAIKALTESAAAHTPGPVGDARLKRRPRPTASPAGSSPASAAQRVQRIVLDDPGAP